MVDLLTKPIRFEDIARVLQSVAAQRCVGEGGAWKGKTPTAAS